MYIWVILATFFVAIVAKTISIRDDYVDLTVVPKAEGVVIGLDVLENSVFAYARNASNPVSYKNGCAGIAPCADNTLSDSDLPLGFKNPYNFQSFIFCLNKTNTDQIEACSSDTWNYALTYGKVPENWQDPVTTEPRYEFIKAIYKATSSYSAGIVTKIDTPTTTTNSTVIGTHFVISSFGGHIVQRFDGSTMIMGIPEIAIDPNCGGIAGGPGVVCPGDIAYIQIIHNPVGQGTPLPAP
ncbi:MAG: hypothetical protein AB7U85_09800 [Alphaproteobacteria bacterium]